MCATDVHDVCSCACSSGPESAAGDGLLLGPWCLVRAWLTELVDVDSAPAPPPSAAAPDVAALDAAGTATTPARPAQATTRTPAAPAAAASLEAPRFANCLVRTWRQARAIAPCLTGSSTNFHDSAAMPMLAAIWPAARARFSVALAGVVSTMTG